MRGPSPTELVGGFQDEIAKIAATKQATFGSEKILTPLFNKLRVRKAVGGATKALLADVPRTPRLFMKHRTPVERAAIGSKVGDFATKTLAENPEVLLTSAIPVPGATTGYLAAKKLLFKKASVQPYQQRTQHTCSAASLLAVLDHYGFSADEHDLSGLIGVRQKGGAETTQIAEAARRLGMDSFEYSFESLAQARLLTDADIPIIADIQSFNHPGSGHYVVITKIDDQAVHLMDPNVDGNVRAISRQEMDERWWDRSMKPPHALMPRWGIVVLPPQERA